MPLSQKSRSVAIGTPLGDDVLLLKSMQGTESLGRPFEFNLELLSENHAISFDDIVGQNVTIRLAKAGSKNRFFNGYVSRFAAGPREGGLSSYSATVVPWLWFLTRMADCRIFQEKTVPEIIQEVFKDHGYTDIEDRLSGTYRHWNYCVQYRETDFNFVSRLMEQEGIYYFFLHEDGKHTIVLADGASGHEPCEGNETVTYRANEKGISSGEYIHGWYMEKQLLSGLYSHRDFDFTKPKTVLESAGAIPRSHAASEFEIFDYPGEFPANAEGDTYARIRIEEIQAKHELLRGETEVRGLMPGGIFSLVEYPREDQNRDYLITSIHHSITSDVFGSGHRGDETPIYVGSFVVIPSEVPFRAARRTPKPQIAGPQTAMVTGPSGEEIHTDEHGRVKVKFHWDRDPEVADKSSCWIRVAQNWAGKKWGAIFLPRIGQEVIVEFLEGDPDRPIITGRVYNGEAKPPYDLPAEKTKSTLKSNSSKGGDGFNELRFEDKKGDEQIFLHAEKDLEERVKNDAKHWIGKDQHTVVKGNQCELIEGSDNTTIGGDQLEKVKGDVGHTIEGNHLSKINGNQHFTVDGDHSTKVKGDVNLDGAANINTKAGQKYSLESGMDMHAKAGMNYGMDAGMAVHIKGGMTVVMEAGVQLSLKVGGNFIDINPGGVFITGTLVMINSGGAAGSGGGSSPTAPAAPDEPDPPAAALEAVDDKPGQVDKAPTAPTPPDPVTFSAAAAVLAAAAQDGTPFCEECARAAAEEAEEAEEETAAIASIAWLDGDDTTESSSVTQWVNLPKEDKWVDSVNTILNKDRLGYKPRFKVKFSAPGAHKFKVKALPGDDNVVYSDAEKERNTKFKWMEEEKEYTTGGDGTKIIDGDFFFPCSGKDTFKLVAEDENNNPPVETGNLDTKRAVYIVPIKMTGMADPSTTGFISEFADVGVNLVVLPTVEVERMANISTDDQGEYQNRLKAGFDGSTGKDKVPYAIALGLTEHLAVKNPNKLVEKADVTVGEGQDPVEIPIMLTGLRSGDGLNLRSLWKNLVEGETWFVSASFVPNDGGATQTIPVEQFTPLPEGADNCKRVRVDVTGLASGTGTIQLYVNAVDRMRGGLAFSGGNLICVCTKAWWTDKSTSSQNQVMVHEMGHKVNMVCPGGGSLPDEVSTRYEGKGHVGNHCHHGLPVQDSYASASGATCVMFGATNAPAAFCENCAPTVKKMDISPGWTP